MSLLSSIVNGNSACIEMPINLNIENFPMQSVCPTIGVVIGQSRLVGQLHVPVFALLLGQLKIFSILSGNY